MRLRTPRQAAALFLLSALLFVSASLAATPAGAMEGPPITISPTDESGGGDPTEETDLGPAADPDGWITGSPTPGDDAVSFLSWLRSLLGGILRGL